jgi:oxygen-independent coproporphyrinogen-3 oxidase
VVRSLEDRRRGSLIEALLCRGQTVVDVDLLMAATPRLAPFFERGLLRREADRLILERGSEPYARSIAAVFDAYRVGEHRFSSAV